MNKRQIKTLSIVSIVKTIIYRYHFYNKIFVKLKEAYKKIISFYLNFLHRNQQTIFSRILRFRGISALALSVETDYLFTSKQTKINFYTFPGEICLKISTKANSIEKASTVVQPTITEIRKITQLNYYGHNHDTLIKIVAKLLRENQNTVSVAESCTGGGLGAIFSSFPGSSNYFLGGIIVYSNQAKISLLEVSEKTLSIYGAVSSNTAKQMALGVKKKLGTSWGLSITGIAGPGGGTQMKPVGLVYIGIADPENKVSSTRCFFGSCKRDIIRSLSEYSALDQLRRSLLTKLNMC